MDFIPTFRRRMKLPTSNSEEPFFVYPSSKFDFVLFLFVSIVFSRFPSIYLQFPIAFGVFCRISIICAQKVY